jgi:hypothetical protein
LCFPPRLSKTRAPLMGFRLLQFRSSLLVSSWGGSGFFFLLILVFIFRLDELPFFFLLDCELEGSVVVTSAVVTNASVPPKLVDGESAENNIRVIQLVIVANPAADEAPSGLNGWVSTETSHLLWFAA